MKGNWTYKQKCIGLLVLFLLFLYGGYQFIFSDTFQLASEIGEKQAKLQWLKEKEKELPALKQKMAEFEKAYSKNDSIAVRDRLTAFISDFADHNQCLVTEIPRNTSYKNDNLKVQTNTFTVKGGYHRLVTLVHQLETECRYLARIISVRFYTLRDLQKKKKDLYVTIVTQTFEQKQHEVH